jgi:Eco57I restriction-modification methylase
VSQQLLFDYADGDQRLRDIGVIHQATGLYTRVPEIEALLDRLGWPHRGERLLDPGAGNGGFLVAALARLPLARDDVAEAVRRVHGFEFWPGAVAEARAAVRNHLTGRGWSLPAARQAAVAIVEDTDYLLGDVPAGVWDVIAANPPYFRLAGLPPGYRVDYEAIVPAHARADLLFAYLDKSAEIVAAGGRIGLITADRWLLNSGSAELRRRLGRLYGVTDLRRLGPGSAFYAAKDRRKGTPPRVHAVSLILTPGEGRPLGSGPFRLDDLPAIDGLPLPQVADIRLAPWLGPAGIFLVSKDDKLPGYAVDRAGVCTAQLVPAVEPRDIDGTAVRPPRRWVIVTGDEQPGAAVLAHLDKTLGRMPPRGRQYPRWRPPESFAGKLPLPYDTVMVPRIATHLKAILLPAGRLPVNHQLVVVSSRAGLDPAAVIAMLEDPLVQAQASALALQVDGGYSSYTAKLLRHLVIPWPVLRRAGWPA